MAGNLEFSITEDSHNMLGSVPLRQAKIVYSEAIQKGIFLDLRNSLSFH